MTQFLLTREERKRLSESQAWEQVFVSSHPTEPEMGVFIDPDVLSRISKRKLSLLDTALLDAYCIAAEGVSHFVYLAQRAEVDQQVTLLELELQAEVDKFVHLIGKLKLDAPEEQRLFVQLFERYSLRAGLDEEERHRYHTATKTAAKFCHKFMATPPEARQPMVHCFFALRLEDKLRMAGR